MARDIGTRRGGGNPGGTDWTNHLHFDIYRIMKIMPHPLPELTRAATAFAALGSEPRLAILRRLVRAGPRGLTIGDLGEDVGITGSVLTHHLKQLVSAGLVLQRRDGRRILSSVDIAAVEALSRFIISECCADLGGPDPDCQKDTAHG
jgi:DNA-binding transcriptional ArsR family regulator